VSVTAEMTIAVVGGIVILVYSVVVTVAVVVTMNVGHASVVDRVKLSPSTEGDVEVVEVSVVLHGVVKTTTEVVVGVTMATGVLVW
jgi:hypothetical protein